MWVMLYQIKSRHSISMPEHDALPIFMFRHRGPRVLHVRYGPNQSYYPECDWGHLSPSYTRKVKGRT